MQVTGSAALILAIVALSFAEDEVGAPHYLVAALLGFLGTLVYIVFNLLGIVAEKAFRQDDNHGNQLRLLLGAIVGWALFYMLVPPGSSIKTHAPYLSIPFLVGYSTRLLVGLLDQFIRAVEITLGLEDKESKLARRQRRKPT